MRYEAYLLAPAFVAGLLISSCSDSNPGRHFLDQPPARQVKSPVQPLRIVQPQKKETSYLLGSNAKLINRLIIRPTGAVVMLKEPCGIQGNLLKAKVFAYEAGNAGPSSQNFGCYEEDSNADKTIRIIESDGVTVGKTIVEVPVEEAFSPENYFIPLDNDPRSKAPRIEALAVASGETPYGSFYETFGITHQPCPIDNNWFLARHIPTASADPYEKCWRETKEAVEVSNFDYSVNPVRLTDEKTVISKNAFFEASTIHTTPRKYSWQNSIQNGPVTNDLFTPASGIPPAEVDHDRKLTQCLLARAEYGQYSSYYGYDGGTSAARLLMQVCPNETADWVNQCVATGQRRSDCLAKAATIAQAANKISRK